MSDINVAGQNLFTSMFEEQYHAEMEELFSKLTDENLVESSVVNELTDYRSYLDYDIKVISRDGRVQLFSKTYGEKSGGETQTPYYVAIAASFAQLYSDRETVRLILLAISYIVLEFALDLLLSCWTVILEKSERVRKSL